MQASESFFLNFRNERSYSLSYVSIIFHVKIFVKYEIQIF